MNIRASMVEVGDNIPGVGHVIDNAPAHDRLSWAGTMCTLPGNMVMISFMDQQDQEGFLVVDGDSRFNVEGN